VRRPECARAGAAAAGRDGCGGDGCSVRCRRYDAGACESVLRESVEREAIAPRNRDSAAGVLIGKAEFYLRHVRDSMTRGGSRSFEDEVYMDALQKAYEEIVEACSAINRDSNIG